MLYHAGRHSGYFILMQLPVFIIIFNTDIWLAQYILSDIGNTQTAFSKSPWFAGFLHYFSIDENLLVAFAAIFIIACIYYKQFDRQANLWSRKTYSRSIIHRIKHIID